MPVRIVQVVCASVLVIVLAAAGFFVLQRHSSQVTAAHQAVAAQSMPGMKHGGAAAAGGSAAQQSEAQRVANDAAAATAHDLNAKDTGASGSVNQRRVTRRAPATDVFDGTYAVGADILPGRYQTTGPRAADYPCQWALLGSGAPGAQAVLGSGTPSGQFVVTITTTDAAFRTSNCGLWHKL